MATVNGLVEVDWALNGCDFYLKAKVLDDVTALVKLLDGSEWTLHGEGRFDN